MGPHENRGIPQQETRGGDNVDWLNAVPGEPLPGRQEKFPEQDSEPLPYGLLNWDEAEGN